LEYGYATRKMGLLYNGNVGGKIEVNVMDAFADTSLSVPRSQGGRGIRLNRAAITFTSKRHSTTDDSTTAAELTEAYLLACEVEGFRSLMSEVGLKQKGPTVLYQDNKAAIQIAMNRGSLSRKTIGTDLRVLTLRNKVEDLKVVPIYLLHLFSNFQKTLFPKNFIPEEKTPWYLASISFFILDLHSHKVHPSIGRNSWDPVPWFQYQQAYPAC
jgi:hypothetical protein